MNSIPIATLRVGPFEVERSAMHDGWTRYSLTVAGEEVRAWASLPSINDCRDALLGRRGTMNGKALNLLLRSADLAAEEAQEIAEAAKPNYRRRMYAPLEVGTVYKFHKR